MMDETIRRDNSGETYKHPASNRDIDRRDEILQLVHRREREQPWLTKREREERWPIG